MDSFEEFSAKTREYLPDFDLARLRAAYDFVFDAYKNRLRLSGEHYMSHILAVFYHLLPLKLDEATMIAALLHGILGDTSIQYDALKERFGPSVASLVRTLELLKTMKPNLKQKDSENFRQMFLSMAKDLRVLLIRLADRLHNMETLQYLPPEKQKFIARETMEIFVPLASRLGIYTFKTRLEDLAFRYLYPEQYRNIEEQLEDFGRENSRYIEDVSQTLKDFLLSQHISCHVEGRIKGMYSIYRKLKRKSLTSIREIFDVFAIRVILLPREEHELESHDQLYMVLGMLHSRWTPLPNRFKDYVAIPKSNGYQSLHTAVMGLAPKLLNQPVEIQIRTERMHREAEYGIASHWLYEDTKTVSANFRKEQLFEYIAQNQKESGHSFSDKRLRSQIDWLRGLSQLQKDILQHDSRENENDDTFKLDIFRDRIFLLTPTGEVKDLPVGATPIDFAYSVHTDIGHRCAMAKVNGKLVPLDCELQNGDVVEIVLKQKPNPKTLWLSFAKTPSAKNKIKMWFKGQNRELSFREGKDLLNKHLSRFHKSLLDDKLSILKNYDQKNLGIRERENLIENIGNGSIPVNTVIRKLFSQEDLLAPLEVLRIPRTKKTAPLEQRILLGGERGLPLRFAHCCQPREGDTIVGYVTRGQKASIHRAHCKILNIQDRNRVLEASWDAGRFSKVRYRVRITISAVNRAGLISDLTNFISNMHVNILEFSSDEKRDNFLNYSLLLEVSDFEQLDQLFNRLEHVNGVLSVHRENLLSQ